MSQLKNSLKNHCKVNGEREILPTLDTKIRWNSLYDFCFNCLRIFNSLQSLSDKEEGLHFVKLAARR